MEIWQAILIHQESKHQQPVVKRPAQDQGERIRTRGNKSHHRSWVQIRSNNKCHLRGLIHMGGSKKTHLRAGIHMADNKMAHPQLDSSENKVHFRTISQDPLPVIEVTNIVENGEDVLSNAIRIVCVGSGVRTPIVILQVSGKRLLLQPKSHVWVITTFPFFHA